MNHCAIQQSNVSEEMRNLRCGVVVCPKPRRLKTAVLHEPVRSCRWLLGHQDMAPAHPFYSGSPPSRVANPLIQDARFGDENFTPLTPPSPLPSALALSPSSAARKVGCVQANFGSKLAVRVEGFDCLDRDRRNCRIPTLA